MKERRQLSGITEADITDMVNKCPGEISILILPADMELTDSVEATACNNEEEICRGK